MVRTAAEPFGPGRRNPEPSKARWTLRDTLAGLLLFLATACVVLWQNAHVAILWDTSYVLDSAVRFAHGQAPYRHFPFVHPPLTFLIQAAIIRFTGRVFFHHVLYAAAVGGLGTVLTWRLALESLRGRVSGAWTVALLVAAPLTVLGIYSIIPIPEYDGDCTFWILVALWLLQRAAAKRSIAVGLAAGVGLCVPLFAKQNMGLPFLSAATGAVLLVLALALIRMRHGQASAEAPEALTLLSVLAAACATLFAAALVLHWTVGIRTYVYWTIRFAGERRMPGFGPMLFVFRDPSLLLTLPCVAVGLVLLWLPHPRNRVPHPRRAIVLAPRVGSRFRWTQIVAFALPAAPFLFTLASLFIYDDADSRGDSLLALWPLLLLLASVLAIVNLLRLRREPSLRALFPLIILAAIGGAFMSQQLWGSTYAIWPLLALLVAEMLAALDRFAARAAPQWFVPALVALISITLLICGGFYTASEDRLSYINLPDAPVERSAFPELAGMATPGPYLPQLDELLRYAAANIPEDDGLILIPGEDPFYFATGRVPRFPVLLFDPTTDPYSPAETAALVRSQNIRWLIVKRDLQIKVDTTPNRAATMQALMGEFTPAARLRGYDVYRR
jgi:succinate dehydrogenase/fumarate reductase cytochrome b subunit